MREIEVKFEIKEIQPIKTKIENLGATYKGECLQEDIWFDTSDKRLKQEGGGLRLRRQNGEATLALKTKQRAVNGLREGEETEVEVKDFEVAKKIIEGLGFREVMRFRKKRESWKIGDVSIVLDDVEEFGIFLELEGSKEEIERVIEELGFDESQRITEHYGQIYEKRMG